MRIAVALLALALGAGTAHAQGRGGGPGGMGKDDEPKKERLTVTFKGWSPFESLEMDFKDALAKVKWVTNIEVDAEKRLATITLQGEGTKDFLKLEEILAKAQVPAALYDPARYLFQHRSGKASTEEILSLLKDATGAQAEALSGGQFEVWAPPIDLDKVKDSADKLRIKLECLTHAKLAFVGEPEAGKSADTAAFLKNLDGLRGVLTAARDDRNFSCLMLKSFAKLDAIRKLGKAAGIAVKEPPKEEAKK